MLLVTVIPFIVDPFPVHAKGPEFLRILESLELWESCVGQSETVPAYLGHPRNNYLIAAISSLETRINHKGQNQGGTEGDKTEPCFKQPKTATDSACQSATEAQT